jgi:hypothetical protein
MAPSSANFRDALAAKVVDLPFLPPPVRDHYGIVVVAGGDLYGRLAWHLITALRGLGCRLPVEVWHLPGEMPPAMQATFESVDGVRAVSADSAGITPRQRPQNARDAGWWLKAFAVRHSSFAEVIFLDADNVPARDPAYLFHDHGYQRTGAMFWPDLPPPRHRAEWVPEAAWRMVGLEPARTARPFESGQLVINRRRHVAACELAVFLNEWSDVTYQCVYGDKDCWLLAWHLLGCRYHMPAKNPAYRHPAICQHDSDGELVFQHCCNGKADLAAGRAIPGIVSRRFAPDAAAEFGRLLTKHRDKPAFSNAGPSPTTK